MKTNKNLLGTLFLAIGTVACTLGAHAANSANAANINNATITTESAMGEPASQENLYAAYYCTTAQAGTFFGGNDTYQTVTTFLAANMANYNSGMSALGNAGNLDLTFLIFDENQYTFTRDNFPSGLAAGDYLAIVAYDSAKTDAEDIVRVRVFSATATGTEGNRSLIFDPSDGQGEAGDWTTVSVPEPTSGMLLLLGVAGLAFRRPASRKRYAATSKRA